MRANSGYIPVETGAPFRGLATTFPSNKINPAFSPNLMNVVIRDGVVKRRAGGRQLGRKLVGRVLGITEFGELGETPYFVVLTSHRQYAYVPADEDYTDLTPGQTSYNLTAVNTGDQKFTIAGDHTADFPTGRLIPVLGSTANDDVYTVVAAVLDTGNTVIEVDEAIPDATVDGAIVIATDFETADDGNLDFVSVTDVNGHRFIVTNGVDSPRVWTGNIGDDFTTWAPTYTGFITCKTLAVFNEHLFLGNVTTTIEETQLVAWSKAGDFDDFGTGSSVGDSGAQILYQMNNGIRAMKVLGDRLAIYGLDTLITCVYVGLPAVFAFEVVIPEGIRLLGPKAITSLNVGHVYVSDENFYTFDGTRGLRVIGDDVYTDLKNHKEQARLYESASLNDYSKRTLYMSIPDLDGGGSLVYTMLYNIFDLSSVVWAKEKYPYTVRAWGFFTNHTEALTWEDAHWEAVDTPWSEEIGQWAEEGEQLEFPTRCYGTEDGRVVICTEGTLSDNGTTPEQLYETKDFEVPEILESILGRWGEIEFEAWGRQVNVIVSTDKGKTYKGIETVVLTGQPETYRLPIDKMSRTLRVKFVATSEFYIRWIRLWVREGGPE